MTREILNLAGVLNEIRKDNPAVQTLLLSQLYRQSVSSQESNFDARKKGDHHPGDHRQNKGVGVHNRTAKLARKIEY
jgi:hypothetical protein